MGSSSPLRHQAWCGSLRLGNSSKLAEQADSFVLTQLSIETLKTVHTIMLQGLAILGLNAMNSIGVLAISEEIVLEMMYFLTSTLVCGPRIQTDASSTCARWKTW